MDDKILLPRTGFENLRPSKHSSNNIIAAFIILYILVQFLTPRWFFLDNYFFTITFTQTQKIRRQSFVAIGTAAYKIQSFLYIKFIYFWIANLILVITRLHHLCWSSAILIALVIRVSVSLNIRSTNRFTGRLSPYDLFNLY